MNRLWGRPLSIFLGCAGILITGYSLTLLPFAVTLLVVGLLCLGGAIAWLSRPRRAPASGEPVAAISQQWEMVQPWVEMVAQPNPATESWAPPPVQDEWPPADQDAWATDPPVAVVPGEAWSADPPEPIAAVVAEVEAPPPAPAPAPVAEEPDADPAPRPPAPGRRGASVFAQATTYQDGEITKRTQIALKLSGRAHRPR